MGTAQQHISKAQSYFSDSGVTDSSGTNTAKAHAQAAIAQAISLDRIANALESIAETPRTVSNVTNAPRVKASPVKASASESE